MHIEQSGAQAMMKFTAQRAGSSCAQRSAEPFVYRDGKPGIM